MKPLVVILTLLLSMLCYTTNAQSIKELQTQREREQKLLNEINTKLNTTNRDIRSSENRQRLTNEKIATQRKLIANDEQQAKILRDSITSDSLQLQELNSGLTTLKQEYGKMVYAAWKIHKKSTALAFLFASDDFNDLTRRVYVMKRYNKARQQRAFEIDTIRHVVEANSARLASLKQVLDSTNIRRQGVVDELDKTQKQLASDISGKKKVSKDLQSQAQRQQANIKEIDKRIKQITDEINAKEAQKKRTKAQKEQDVVLSGKFKDNKGKMPWPVENVSKNLKPNSSGKLQYIVIVAQPGAVVRAIFEGEVVDAKKADRFLNHYVVVRSGEYYVYYTNLGGINVKIGDKVTLQQRLGTLIVNPNNPESEMNLRIVNLSNPKAPNFEDPLLWLRK
jgi:septal ring factor EnvC (AmiA/AmiB activator)